MANFDLIVRPSLVQVALRSNAGLFPSPLTPSAQVINRGGPVWVGTLTFNNKKFDDRAELMALLAELNGPVNSLRVPVSDNPRRGAYGGTPLVSGAGQQGLTLSIDGAATNVTNWIRRGDYFSVEVNGEQELKIATADASTDGSGQATLSFAPRLRASPLDNAPIFVQDDVLPRPQGLFKLTDQDNGWASRPGASDKIGSFTIPIIEDVFGTQ